MRKYKIGWLPGDGIGVEVLEAAKIVLDKLELSAEYLPGDIGWDCWCKEGDPLPSRTIDLLKNVDAALFGAITSNRPKSQPRNSPLPSETKDSPTVHQSSGCASCLTCTSAYAPARLISATGSTSRRTSTLSFFAKIRKICTPASSSHRCRRSYLKQFHLQHKVKVNNGRLSTTAVSQGQRKRLALLTAYLEDRPFYLFDEWASDQDPWFKRVFYTQLLPELKSRGKTILVICHDDRYFDIADRIIKLDYGKLVTAQEPAQLMTVSSAVLERA